MNIASPLPSMPTKIVDFSYQPDETFAKYRIGLIALSSDEITERDYHRMLPDEVAFYTGRVKLTNPCTVENLRKMGPQLADATRLILNDVPLDVITYSCTSGSVAIGPDEVTRLIQSVRPGVTVVTPVTAAVNALKKLDIDRITMVTPYIDSVNQEMRSYFESQGVEVLNLYGFGLENDKDMARLSPDTIRRAAVEAVHPDADGVFVSCTGIRSAEAVGAIEREIGKPTLCSNASMIWDALRSCGYNKPLEGYGRLLLS